MLIGTYQPNNPGSVGQIQAFAKAVGFTPRITSYYTSWFGQPFPTSFAQTMAKQGTQTLVQWQPRGTTNAAIAAGQWDLAIWAVAKAINQVNGQVIVSYGQEMNGNWYEWGTAKGGVAASNPTDYINAYRHIWQIFQKAGTRNVTWLWDPNVSYTGSTPLQQVYPGDKYVNWVGFDGYYSTAQTTFDSLFLPSLAEVRKFTSKPFIIGESGVSKNNPPAQLSDLFAGADLAGAVAVVYFDEAQSGDSMHQDWRIEDNPAALSAFRTSVNMFAERPLIP
jgi:glycosyl hydrolase family 26